MRPCTWFRISWLRPWHWSRGTPPASSMPSTRVVQRSLITAGTRKKGSPSNSCLGQEEREGTGLGTTGPCGPAEASSSSFEKSSMNDLCLPFPPALLLPLWTDIHSDISFIHFFNKHLQRVYSVPTPKTGAAGDPVTPFLLETLPRHRSPHNKLKVLSLMNLSFSLTY